MAPNRIFKATLEVILFSIPIFFALIAVELAWDFRQAKKSGQRSYNTADALSNLACGAIDQLAGLFSTLLVIGAYAWVFEWSAAFRSYQIAGNWLVYLGIFIAVDFLYYWSHRWSHGVHLLWTGHIIHHQSEHYNLSVALRQGAFQRIWLFWIYLPLALLGVEVEWFVLAKAINLLYQFWIHTEHIQKMGKLEWILNTPSHHRVHHGRNAKYIDKNHAGVFIIWDRLFGTFQEEEERPLYGVTKPLTNFNPVSAHLSPFQDLLAAFRATPLWSEKLKVVFFPPGALDSKSSASINIDSDHEHRERLSLSLSGPLQLYFIIQQSVLLALLTVFLLEAPIFSQMEQALIVFFGLLQLFLLHRSMKESSPLKAEFGRFTLLSIAAGYLFCHSLVLGTLTLSLIIASLVWLRYYSFGKEGATGSSPKVH